MARKPKVVVAELDPFLPAFVTEAARNTQGRDKRNQAGLSDLAGELENVSRGVTPCSSGTDGDISVSDAICLCQKAYYNIPIFRNTIDIQTEFANSRLHFRGRNKNSIAFFTKWYETIDGWSLAERFFREWFRSGNVFVYKFLYEVLPAEIKKMSRASAQIPLKYIILNPADIRCEGAATFINSKYTKVLNNYELARLKNPKTEEEKRFLENLPPEVRKDIKSGTKPSIPIEPQYLVAVFCGKQDYEALSVPMYYPVLFDIDLKLEFKKAEKVIARTTDYIVLLVTAGDKDRDPGVNSRILAELQMLFEQESVGRVLVSDWTTKLDFAIPDLNKILGPEKYKVVNEDIANGLMNIFWGEEKFANSMVKIKVFLERLQSARDAFLNGFLKKEMRKIAKDIGMQDVPEPVFDKVDLKDEVEYMKVYTRMAEMGILTPEELFESIESYSLPLIENSVLSQTDFKKQKDKGLYEPLVSSKKEQEGRPAGTKAPQKTKKVSPIGASKYSLQKISDNIKVAGELLAKVEEQFRKINNIKRLDAKEKDLCWTIAESIISAKDQSEWEKVIPDFIEIPVQPIAPEVVSIAAEHNLSYFLASILRDSKI